MTLLTESALVEQTAPTVEPVTSAECKTHSRIDTAADDDYLDTLIVTARKWCEAYTNRSFINTTWDWFYPDDFPTEFRLPRSPVSSVTSVKYIDTDGSEQTLDSGTYQTNLKTSPALIKEEYGQTWPSVRGGDYDTITIRFVAGYGAAATSVPEPIKHAIKFLVAHLYENREPHIVGMTINSVPMAVENLLSPYVVDAFG